MKKLHIDVRASFIQAGVPKTADECPLALAILGDHCLYAKVGHFNDKCIAALVLASGRVVFVDLPPEADAFIKAFDAGKKVQPIAFDISYDETSTRA